MTLTTAMPSDRSVTAKVPVSAQDASSAVSWGAIFAGAAAAAVLSLILVILGTGLGLSSVSPWAQAGVTAATFGVSTIVWLTVTQVVASGMGGYLAGRLRTKWASVHTDEVYFRDTAHGFLAWAIASLATAALLSSVIASMVGAGAQAGATIAGGAVAAAGAGGAAMASGDGGSSGESGAGPSGYFIDMLFRKDPAAPVAAAGAPDSAAPAAEVARIFASAVQAGALAPDDARYLGQLVSQRTGLATADAEKRVADTFTRMQTMLRNAQTTATETADKARKATAYGALWLFVSLLIGAFVASFAATLGGRQRDL